MMRQIQKNNSITDKNNSNVQNTFHHLATNRLADASHNLINIYFFYKVSIHSYLLISFQDTGFIR